MAWKRRSTSDFNAEIAAHVQLEMDRLREQGMSEEDARAAALRAFGNRTAAEERFYETNPALWGERLWQNIRFGMRMMGRSPVTTAAAVLTLALGIGANTAIFSLLNAVILRDLPVRNPKELVLFGPGHWRGSVDSVPNRSWQLFSYHFFQEFRRKNQVYADVAAIDSILMTPHGRVGGAARMETVGAELVSGSFFETLGVKPVLGRVLNEHDDVTPGGHPVAVASYAWWQQRLGGNPSALGTTVTIGSTTYTIIGVSAAGFSGVTVAQSPDVWIPLAMEKEVSPGWNGLEKDWFQSLYVIARRKPGVGMGTASADTNLLFQQIMHEYAGPSATAQQLENLRHARIDLTSAATGLSQIRRFTSPLLILMSVVAVLLIIACANLANLLLARAAARQREMAIRMSIGAGRARLIRQLLVESALLGIAGGSLGILLASAASRLLVGLVPTGSQPLPLDVAPDATVLAFTLGVTLVTVLLFGTAPALHATHLDPVTALKDGRAASGLASHNRLARGLVVAQVALSMVLLAGAGLFLRSLMKLLDVPTGFDRENVLLMGVDFPGAGYGDDARTERLMRRVEDRVGSIAGVKGAAFAFVVFDGGGWTDSVTVPGRPVSENDPEVFHNIVGAQYLGVLKMPVLLGRALTAGDDGASKVAVINETMARLYFPGVSPLGRIFSVGKSAEWQNVQVVGVVKDAKYMELREKPTPAAFYPHAQHAGFLYNFLVSYTGEAGTVVPRIRRAFAEFDPNLPVSDAKTLNDVVSESVLHQKLVAQLCTLFALLAAFLAAIGIYGVMSYATARRTNEFGVRMALGAEAGDVLWMVLREVLGLVAMGIAAGVPLAAGASRLVESLLFGIAPFDPPAIGAAAVAMTAVALFAGYLPARRATKIEPMAALRYE
jgi:predicted permease